MTLWELADVLVLGVELLPHSRVIDKFKCDGIM